MRRHRPKAFTLIELVIVLTILAILASVAIPSYQNLEKHAKDAAVKGILGSMREAILMYRMMEITSGRQPGVPIGAVGSWPTNGCPAIDNVRPYEFSHFLPKVTQDNDVPDNPWAKGVVVQGFENNVRQDYSLVRGQALLNPPATYGWAYNMETCEFWANTNSNGGVPSPPFPPFCPSYVTTENCF